MLMNIGHTHSWIKLSIEEKENHDDAFLQRFLYCAPPPLLDESLHSLLSTPKPKFSLITIMYSIKMICQTPLEFKLDEEAYEDFILIMDQSRKIIKNANNVDSFIL
jgi:hypothetical protein